MPIYTWLTVAADQVRVAGGVTLPPCDVPRFARWYTRPIPRLVAAAHSAPPGLPARLDNVCSAVQRIVSLWVGSIR